MLLYTAGKYKGKNEGEKLINIATAMQVAIELWNDGHAVICPHLNTMDFEHYTNLDNVDFVELDLLIVERCDGIVMLPGWKDSRGAVREWEHAMNNNVRVYMWPDKPHWKTSEALEKKRDGAVLRRD